MQCWEPSLSPEEQSSRHSEYGDVSPAPNIYVFILCVWGWGGWSRGHQCAMVSVVEVRQQFLEVHFFQELEFQSSGMVAGSCTCSAILLALLFIFKSSVLIAASEC